MPLEPLQPATGRLPRRISETVLWAGDCLDTEYRGRTVHGHFGVFVVRTPGGTYMVDGGHPTMWDSVEPQLDAFLGDDQIDFIFPTHAEIPHAGLLPRWMRKYPGATAVCDARDYHLYMPDEYAAGRFRHVGIGDSLDLGDRQLLFVPAIWRDLPTSLWAFDTSERVLFVADAFGFLHPHDAGRCDLLLSEQEVPDLEMAQFFNQGALFWTQFVDVPGTFPDVDELLDRVRPRWIAPAHGAIVDSVDESVPFFKHSMSAPMDR